jgi:hypothetical protein
MRLALAFLIVASCTPSGNTPPPVPDASDAAPQASCAAACSTMVVLGCPTSTDCAVVMAHVEASRSIRSASGQPITCAMVAAASTKAAEQSLGVDCP